MYSRRKARAVISGDVADLALLLGFCVHAGIGAADKPEHRWRAPLGSERSEVLAGRGRLGFLHTVSRKVLAKRIAYSLSRFRIVLDKGITVKRRDLRLLRCP